MSCASALGSIDPAAYGAIGNGVNDDTAAIQAACNAAQTANDVVYLGNATYLISAPVTANCDINGESEQHAIIRYTGNYGLMISTVAPVHWEKFAVTGPGSGVAILVQPPSGTANSESTFERVLTAKVGTGFKFVAASWWHMEQCLVEGYTEDGVYVEDTANPDAGDACMTNCLILGGGPNGIAICQVSAGGLKITACKLVNGLYGYYLALAPGAVTGDLQITGNSIEGFASAICLTNGAGSAFYDSTISGNELGVESIGICAMANEGGTWLQGLTICGNVIHLGAVSAVGMDLNGVSGVSISGNSIIPEQGSCYGIILRPLAQWCDVSGNTGVNITYPVTNMGQQNVVQ